jgi:hypothetical protein
VRAQDPEALDVRARHGAPERPTRMTASATVPSACATAVTDTRRVVTAIPALAASIATTLGNPPGNARQDESS